MSYYTKKSPVDLAWKENRARIAQQAKFLLDRLLNEALAELDKQFIEALEEGRLLELDATKEELKALLLSTAQNELGPGATKEGAIANEV